MMDSFSEVTHRGFGQNLISSIKGVVVGLLLFAISFPIRNRSAPKSGRGSPLNPNSASHGTKGSNSSSPSPGDREEGLEQALRAQQGSRGLRPGVPW